MWPFKPKCKDQPPKRRRGVDPPSVERGDEDEEADDLALAFASMLGNGMPVVSDDVSDAVSDMSSDPSCVDSGSVDSSGTCDSSGGSDP